jgi:hypothetical protein
MSDVFLFFHVKEFLFCSTTIKEKEPVPGVGQTRLLFTLHDS